MEEEQTKASTNKTTQKEQKKSEKDKNASIYFGGFSIYLLCSIYN